MLGQPPSLLVHARHFAALGERIVRELENFHAANPLVPGLAKEDLRARAAASPERRTPHGGAPTPSPALFAALLAQLAERGQAETEGEWVRLRGREVQLSAEERAAKETLSAAFERAGLAVPSAREVLAALPLDRPRAAKILQILLKEKVLVRVTEDLIFHRAALDGLRQTLAARKAQNPRLSVADFKEMTGVSRKYAIPLLEYLDRERVTRREGEARIIL
jgi:selenocysteine-specific elongation factor